MYGEGVGEIYRSYAAVFNAILLGIFLAYLYLENLRKKEREEKEKVRNYFRKYVLESIGG